ncbi:MAG: PilZ domain-containing protein [Deltaproteobacteria bacterium]|nr:PilZ domain-containing protein [Deltaproteobacteria bacterium]
MNSAQDLLKKYKEETSDRVFSFTIMESKIDRRSNKRVKLIKWPAKVLIKDKSIDGILRNISVNGAFIYYSEPHGKNLPLKLHKVVDLIIEATGVAPLYISAEVIWSNILSTDEKNTLIGVGLRFIEVPEKDRQFLQDFVRVYTDPMLNRTYWHLRSKE